MIRNGLVIILVALLGPWGVPSKLRALDPAPTTVDAWVLEPDAWVLARIDSMDVVTPDGHIAPMGQGTVRLHLSEVQVLRSRLPEPITMIAALGYLESNSPESSTARVDHVALALHESYLFAIRGGSWVRHAFAHDPMRVDPEYVSCGSSARVYAFSVHGPVCGTPRTHYGSPLTADEVRTQLVQRIAAAEQRWPAYAGRLRSATRPLELEPRPAAGAQP